ncbi:hypothetical protein GALL_107660 [mine drainage metagenome]|uniref:General secretion pathway GspH domain-containing protein n=1 Tax=mine drainage metagenome TaxID=410659 RepID=A0A1J5SFG5_9ZZZZ
MMKKSRQSGFTLIELITVMIVLGILAVFVLPRFANVSDFNARGFLDETRSLLQFAQQSAVAQRRDVCVSFSASGASLSAGTSSACGTPLTGPNGATPFTVTARSGTGYSTTPSNFYFDALGKASAGQTITVTGSGSVTVEAETGYVH